MGIYLNPTNESFIEAVSSEIYVDKSELISFTNKKMRTSQKYICVSRPRRFGKSMNLGMLSAYYSKGCNSTECPCQSADSDGKTGLLLLTVQNMGRRI